MHWSYGSLVNHHVIKQWVTKYWQYINETHGKLFASSSIYKDKYQCNIFYIFLQKKKQSQSLSHLIATLTKESRVVLTKEVFTHLEPKTKVEPKKKTKNQKSKTRVVLAWEPCVGDIIWAKMRGYCLWPGKVHLPNLREIKVDSIFFFFNFRSRQLMETLFLSPFTAIIHRPNWVDDAFSRSSKELDRMRPSMANNCFFKKQLMKPCTKSTIKHI